MNFSFSLSPKSPTVCGQDYSVVLEGGNRKMVDLVTGILFKRIRDGSFDIMCWEGAGGGGEWRGKLGGKCD